MPMTAYSKGRPFIMRLRQVTFASFCPEFMAKKFKLPTSIDYPDSLDATNAKSLLDFCPKNYC